MGEIPWILHQTYKTKDIPSKWQKYYETWRNKGDPWIEMFYLDEDLRNLIKNDYPQFLQVYDGFRHFIEKCDFARYAMMHKYGGVYADLDMEQVRSFKPLLSKGKALMASEPLEHTRGLYKRELVLCNACMLSNPGNPFWLGLMNYIKDTYNTHKLKDPVQTTGPMGVTYFYESVLKNGGKFSVENKTYFLKDYLEILPSCSFFSEVANYSHKRSKFCTNESEIYAIHHWTNDYAINVIANKLKDILTNPKETLSNTHIEIICIIEWVIIMILIVIIIAFSFSFSKRPRN